MNKLPNDYFPHDFNARYDRKILRCRKVLGLEGYGIYWMLIETLCTQENFSYPLKDIDLLADDYGCSVEKVEAVIKQFDLFQIDDQARFFSLSLIARMQKYLELSIKARNSANVRWEKARKLKGIEENYATALPPHSECNAIKEKDIKEKKMNKEVRRINKDYFLDLLPATFKQSEIDAWVEWVDYREETKKKLTRRSAKKQIDFLLIQPDFIAVINQTIKNQWQGLFEVKDGTDKKRSSKNYVDPREAAEELASAYHKD